MLLLSVNAMGYEMKLFDPVPGAQGYEFTLSRGGVEKLVLSPGPFIDSKDLVTGQYKYKYRIRKNNKWSSWSGLSRLNVWKKPKPSKKNMRLVTKSSSPLSFDPFLFAVYRSIEAKNDGVIKKTRESALRIGTDFSSKYYTSQIFYETGKTFSRIDLGAMKIISPNFYVGMRLMFASAEFKDSGQIAKILSTNAFVQATGKHQVQNGFVFSLTGAGTIQGSALAHLDVSKSWIVKKKLKISPTIGYEYLYLKSSDTRLNSASFSAGVFAKFPL
jgi:hypothetical protein